VDSTLEGQAPKQGIFIESVHIPFFNCFKSSFSGTRIFCGRTRRGRPQVFEEGVWSSLSATSRRRAVGRGITRVALRFVDEDREMMTCAAVAGALERETMPPFFRPGGGKESAWFQQHRRWTRGWDREGRGLPNERHSHLCLRETSSKGYLGSWARFQQRTGIVLQGRK